MQMLRSIEMSGTTRQMTQHQVAGDLNPLALSLQSVSLKVKLQILSNITVELHLFGLIGTASYPNMQKIRVIDFFSENKLHWQFEVPLLLFAVCTCVETFRPRLI